MGQKRGRGHVIPETRAPATALSRGGRCRDAGPPHWGSPQPRVPAQTDSRRAPLPPSRFLCRKRWHSAPNATPPRAGDGKAGEHHPCHCHLGTRDPGRDRGGRWGRPARAFGGNCGQVVSGPFPSPASDPPRSLGLSAPPRSPEPPRSHKRAPDAGCTRCEPGTRAIAATNEDAKPPWESAPAQTREPGVYACAQGAGGALGPDVPAGQPGGVSTSTPASSGSLAMFAFEQFGG